MTPEQVADHVVAMFEEYGDVTAQRVIDDLHVGDAKAREALAIARTRLHITVLPTGTERVARS